MVSNSFLSHHKCAEVYYVLTFIFHSPSRHRFFHIEQINVKNGIFEQVNACWTLLTFSFIFRIVCLSSLVYLLVYLSFSYGSTAMSM